MVPLMREDSQWKQRLNELEQKAAEFDTKLANMKRTFEKTKRREQRLITKLTAFMKWIELAEEDLER